MPNHRKPNEIHLLEGTERADRNTNKVVDIPSNLTKLPEIKDFKNIKKEEIFDMLKDWVIGVTGAAEIDGLTLSLLVDQYELYSEAKKDIANNGTTFERETGRKFANPSVQIMANAHDKIVRLMREFGMTPATRADISIKAKIDNDPFENFMNGPKRKK